MEPIGPLMWEHRTIERAVKLLEKELEKIQKTGKSDHEFLNMIVDFFRIYADRTHHGKEEDILFKALNSKSLSREHKKIMDELIEEHKKGRKLTNELKKWDESHGEDSSEDIDKVTDALKELLQLYPQHIEKEDKHFFFPIMDYFSKQEREDMLEKFYEFDRQLIHEKYKKLIDEWEDILRTSD
jgi:hemerythrin-like domain-containing protein